MRYQIKQPELHDLLREIRSLIDSYGSDKFLVGELPDVEYLGNGTDELHMVFNFPLMYEGITKEDVFKKSTRAFACPSRRILAGQHSQQS